METIKYIKTRSKQMILRGWKRRDFHAFIFITKTTFTKLLIKNNKKLQAVYNRAVNV